MGRSDVTFVVDGTRCSGWWYPAADGGDDADASSDDRRRPCVVMAHGLAAVKEMRLDAYAERFAAAGMFVFVFDYRGFGSSEGEPPTVDIDAQHADWEAAVAYARTSPGRWHPDRFVGLLAVGWPRAALGATCQCRRRYRTGAPHTDAVASARSTGLAASARLGIRALRRRPGGARPIPPLCARHRTTRRAGHHVLTEATEYLDLVPEGSTSISGSPLGLASGSPATPRPGIGAPDRAGADAGWHQGSDHPAGSGDQSGRRRSPRHLESS